MKTYKLNKTFENSMCPIEKELYEIKNSTKKTQKDLVCGIAAAAFSGIGTSLLFQEHAIPKLINQIFKQELEKNENSLLPLFFNITLVAVIFILLFLGGWLINRYNSRETNSEKKKKTERGREELEEKFHKYIINNITIGMSFVDKAEEGKYEEQVDKMYLFEAAYYFKIAKKEMEAMKLIDPEKNKNSDELIELIGKDTIKITIDVFQESVGKLKEHIPNSQEKKDMEDIFVSLEIYLDKLQNDKTIS